MSVFYFKGLIIMVVGVFWEAVIHNAGYYEIMRLMASSDCFQLKI